MRCINLTLDNIFVVKNTLIKGYYIKYLWIKVLTLSEIRNFNLSIHEVRFCFYFSITYN